MGIWRLGRRTATVLALTTGAIGLSATPALAHTVGGAGATNYHSRIVSVSPPTPGLTVSIAENGNKLEVVNHTGQTVIVLGYSGEPYLMITPSAVQENLRSSATYLNQTRFGTNPVPASADNKGVEWKQISTSPIAVWHDHRIHWNSKTPPPPVAAAPGQRHHIVTWHVDMQLAGQPVVVTGTLDWIPGPSSLPYDGIIIVLLIGAAALVWKFRRSAAALLVVLLAADVVNTLGVASDRARTSVAKAFTVYPAVDVVWVLALGTVVLVARGMRFGWQLLIAVAAWMLIVGGLAEVTVLNHSSAPYAWPLTIQRICISIEIPLGLVLVFAGIVELLTTHRRRPAAAAGEAEPLAATSP